MLDEETGAEPRVTSASISDQQLLLIRDDGSVFIAQMDSNSELEEVEKADGTLQSTKWASGCLYNDTLGTFRVHPGGKAAEVGDSIVIFLLSSAGALHVSERQNRAMSRARREKLTTLDLRPA